MNLSAFQSLRSGLQLNAGPATSQVRNVFEAALHEELLASGAFVDLEVGSTDVADHLLVALGTFRHGIAQGDIVRAVERAWAACSFHYWQAHSFLTAEGHVELQAATLDRPGGRYMTLHLVVREAVAPEDLAPVTAMPEQRRTVGQSAEVRELAHTA